MVKRLIDSIENAVHNVLGSKKLMLTVAAASTAVAKGDPHAALVVVLAYLGVEGAADFKSR